MTDKLKSSIEELEKKISEDISELNNLEMVTSPQLLRQVVAKGEVTDDDVTSMKEVLIRNRIKKNLELLQELKGVQSKDSQDEQKARQIDLDNQYREDALEASKSAANKQLVGSIIGAVGNVAGSIAGGVIPAATLTKLSHESMKMEYEDRCVAPSSMKEFMRKVKL